MDLRRLFVGEGEGEDDVSDDVVDDDDELDR